MVFKWIRFVTFSIDWLRFLSCLIFCFFVQSLEPVVHGRGRKSDSLEDTYFGVHQEQLYARKLKPVEGTLMLGHFVFRLR